MNRALAFIFDLDGTLVETEELKALSYARAAAKLRPDLGEADVVDAFTSRRPGRPTCGSACGSTTRCCPTRA